jgi:hypothetical protein
VRTPGTASLSGQSPWVFRTSHGLVGSIAATPGACRDEGGGIFDFTLTPTAVPGLTRPAVTCCRIVR